MNPEVVTITLNPAIDHTVFLETLGVGAVNRCERHHRQAGGKGVNVSSMLGQYGVRSVATGFLGAENPRLFEELFRRDGVEDAFVRVAGETRTGIKIVETGGRRTTDINFAGPAPGPGEIAALEETIGNLIRPGRWFVFAGSLPPGLGAGFLHRLLSHIKTGGGLVAADTSGDALRTAIDTGVDLIKPNEHELGEYLGVSLDDPGAQVDAALRLQRERVPRVILSLGSRGALIIDSDARLLAAPAPVEVLSTVGAGDSLLAGYLAGLLTGMGPADRARLATTFAGCALADVSRRLPDPAALAERRERVRIESLGA